MRFRILSAVMVGPIFLAACAQTPMSPTVAVMPAPNKPFDVFASDQAVCKQFAESQVGAGAQSANNQQVATALIGTALGAGLGAAIGGGRGAAIGAASGAVGGTALGGVRVNQAQMTIQQQYDLAYSQCMYSRGNQVPGFTPVPGYMVPR
ncbi:MAG: glycine zipper family protein [Acetobacteraceae bacterium]|nr:glycine zipper family protein [Pseudomonadota bacterium]